jgi:hypothetical protein
MALRFAFGMISGVVRITSKIGTWSYFKLAGCMVFTNGVMQWNPSFI